jgi:hypothetical protein
MTERKNDRPERWDAWARAAKHFGFASGDAAARMGDAIRALGETMAEAPVCTCGPSCRVRGRRFCGCRCHRG